MCVLAYDYFMQILKCTNMGFNKVSYKANTNRNMGLKAKKNN